MGGERRSTTHQRETGKTCAQCGNPLDNAPPWYRPGYRSERLCNERCAPRPHAVYMRFARQDDGRWLVTVQRKGGSREILSTSRFADPALVLRMAQVGHAFASLADRQAVEYALANLPEGLTELHLTDEQLAWLNAGKRPPRRAEPDM